MCSGHMEEDMAALAVNDQQKQAAHSEIKQKKEPKQKKSKKGADDGDVKAPLRMDPAPDYLQARMDVFERVKAEQEAKTAAQPQVPIKVFMPDGAVREGISWVTSPMDIAVAISKSFSDKQIVCKVTKEDEDEANGIMWDLERPLEHSCKLRFFDFDTPEGTYVFRHSSAHILGEACELHYGCKLAVGPPIDEGFYYEMAIDGRVVTKSDYNALETLTKEIVKQKQKFERVTMSKAELLEMFAYNPLKTTIIDKKMEDNTSTTIYRCGPMVDFCRGPHIAHTGKVKALAIMSNSSSYFLGNKDNETLQRIYGTSFPDSKQMTEHKAFLAAAESRDHRRIGKDQELFFFNELSPGSTFWLPHGARIYNTLMDYIKSEYHKRGYQEVMSPNMFNTKLWDTSGHNAKYADDMFALDVEKEKFALKPMNCPGHCVIFSHRDRSYRELPLRMADFGVLHRNESSGSLSGLTRVRRFQQDDAHIFCMPSQIEDEILGVLDFINCVYNPLGFKVKLNLSTRPEKYLGEISTWNEAEAKLESALNKAVGKDEWALKHGDGAFYGPKIDITITDALKRAYQCATIQLDFQLPERFKLEYTPATEGDGKVHRPVMIHRAVLGSLERFIGILTEHTAGKWPFWLSPRQVVVIPVAVKYKTYAEKVQKTLWDAGLYADVDMSDNTLPKKIRNGETSAYNFIFVVGSEEEESNSVNVRARIDDLSTTAAMENKDKDMSRGAAAKTETVPLDKVLKMLLRLKESHGMKNELLE